MFTLNTKADRMVALVLNHGIRREHRFGTPAADLSVCFLTRGILSTVVPWWMNFAPPNSRSDEIVHTFVGKEELALLKRFVNLFAARAKDSAHWKVPPERCPVPKNMRKYFVRVLFPPLFSPDREVADAGMNLPDANSSIKSTAQTSMESEMRSGKTKGACLVKKKHFTDAISCYQRAVVTFHRSIGIQGAATSQLAAQCYLNIARCVLEQRDAATAKEAEMCCDVASQSISYNVRVFE